MHETKSAALPHPGSRLLTRLMAVSVFIVAAAGTALSAHAQSHHGHGRGGQGDAERMMFGGPPEHFARVIDHVLDGLNATEAQRAQIKQIALTAAADVKTQRESGRGLREKGVQIFAAPTVDADAAEALRQQMSAQHEQASKRTLQAMLDVARVLTPEQRAKLGERMKARQAMMEDRMQRRHQKHMSRTTPPIAQPAPQK